jgi:serine/threonine protein phosphatase PrpC
MQVYYFNQQGMRPKQEDSLYISYDQSLFVVCDGVGGSHDGGLASQIVTESIAGNYKISTKDHDHQIQTLILHANKDLQENSQTVAINHTSTTIALLMVHDKHAYLTHIGDSKIFYISKTKDEWWVSKDHSFVQELFEAGILESEYEMRTHPLRSRITQAISNDHALTSENIRIHHIADISKDDIFIICTDGVMENITSDEMIKLFTDPKRDVKNAFEYLKNSCSETSRDNNSAVVIEL